MTKDIVGVIAIAFVLAAAAGRALSADSPPDDQLIQEGRAIWLTVAGIGCAGCHGRFGEGDIGVGPYNRGVGLTKIQASIQAVPQMGLLKGKLDQQSIEAVAAYNSWLGQLQLVKTLLKRDRFDPNTVDIYPGTPVQLAINNSSQTARKFNSPNMNIQAFQVAGREVYDFVWQAPDQEGRYTLRCEDCLGQGQEFTVNVRRDAKPFRPADKQAK